MMKNKILDLLFDIENFKHTQEVINAINSYSPLMASDIDKVLCGIYLILSEVNDDITLQRPTLLHTMLNVKTRYGVLTKFKHTISEFNAITLAITHVKDCLKAQRNIVKSVEFCEQQKEQRKKDERIVNQLANDIKKMLQKAKTKKDRQSESNKVDMEALLERLAQKGKRKKYQPVERKPIWALKVGYEDAEPFIAGYKRQEVALKLKMSNGYVVGALNGKFETVKGYKLWIE